MLLIESTVDNAVSLEFTSEEINGCKGIRAF